MGRDTLSSRRLGRDLRVWIRAAAPMSGAGVEGVIEARQDDGLESPESPPGSADSVDSVASSPSPTSTAFPATVLASSTAPPPALEPTTSSAAGIVTLTAIPHTPTFPSSTSSTSKPTTLSTSTTSALVVPPASSTTSSTASSTTSVLVIPQVSSTTSALVVPQVSSTTSTSTSVLRTLPDPTSSQTTFSSAEPTVTSGSGSAQEQNAVQKIESPEGQPGQGIHVALPVLASLIVAAAFVFFAFRWRRHRKRAQVERDAFQPGPRGGSVSSFPADYQPPLPRSDGKTNTKIMDELMSAAYAAENGGYRGTSEYSQNGYLIDEKFTAIPEPEPVTLRGLRNSIARFFRGQYPPKVTLTSAGNAADGQPPPVPVIPDAFKNGPNAPQLVESRLEPHPGTRIKSYWSDSSPTDTMGSAGKNGTLLSLYATESHGLGYFHKERMRSGGGGLAPMRPAARAPSGAPSVAELETPSSTESTWRTWGVSQPKTPTRTWVEKCIRAGGLR